MKIARNRATNCHDLPSMPNTSIGPTDRISLLKQCCLFTGYCDCRRDPSEVLDACDKFLAKLARKNYQRLGMPFEDLLQDLRVDVWTHADQFNPQKGSITTWAGWRFRAVRSAILHARHGTNWAKLVTGVDPIELDQIPQFLDLDEDSEPEL